MTIEGLDVTGFSGYGLVLNGGDAFMQDNYIGTAPSGSVAAGNTAGGIEILTSGNTVGGSAAGTGNVVSGNSGDGIDVFTSSNVIEGNIVGLDAAGTAALPNAQAGVNISASDNTVGGLTASERNIGTRPTASSCSETMPVGT